MSSSLSKLNKTMWYGSKNNRRPTYNYVSSLTETVKRKHGDNENAVFLDSK